MLNKTVITVLAILGTVPYAAANAGDAYTTCSIEVAVASPPVQSTERVVFNVSSERGTNRSITLKGGSAPTTFMNLICSGVPYTISATLYTSPTPSHRASAIGQCVLKAGDVVMDEAYNSISVVFPNDFKCS